MLFPKIQFSVIKSLLRVVGMWIALGATLLQAQNFNASDSFSSVVPGWSSDSSINNGLFTVSGGVLNFSDSGLSTGQTSTASRAWLQNSGSYTADWQVQIDLSLNLTQIPGQITYWNLSIGDSANSTNRFVVEFVRSYLQLDPFVRGTTWSFGSPGTQSQVDITGSSIVSVLASYTAALHTLNLSYDSNGPTGGYVFTNLYSSDIGPGGAGWNMTTGETFDLRVSVSNVANASGTPAVSTGLVFADNFTATAAAIPEPSTYAAAFGALVLGAAVGLRRRRHAV